MRKVYELVEDLQRLEKEIERANETTSLERRVIRRINKIEKEVRQRPSGNGVEQGDRRALSSALVIRVRKECCSCNDSNSFGA